MVNSGDRISPVKSLLILATYLFALVGLAHAQMGINFDKCACKDEFENVKEFKEMGETFTSAEINDKKIGLKTTYTFYNGKLVRVKFSRSDDREWSEDLAHRLWEKWFKEDEICSRREPFDGNKKEDGLVIFNGKDRNQMALGRGKYKSSLLLESSTMTTLKSKYVKTQIGKSNKTAEDDDQYQPLIRLPWQKRVTKEEYMARVDEDRRTQRTQYISSPEGTGFITPTGAVYGPNGQMTGQIINRRTQGTEYISSPEGTGYISPTGAVYGPNGQMNGQIINR